MKKTLLLPISSALKLRLAVYTTAGLASMALTPTVKSDIIYSGPLTLAVPNTTAGVYLNLVTGTTGTTAVAGYDVNPFGNSFGLSFFIPSSSGLVAASVGTPPLALPPGTVIGPASTFTTAANSVGTNFQVTGTEFLGVRFLNEATGATDYGWLSLSTTATTGFPATVTGYAYNNTGAAIAAGAVPEPGTVAAMCALAVGAFGLRRWQGRKSMTA